MSTLCPYCKAPLTGQMALPAMHPRKQRIYDAVLEAGPRGISPEDLLICMYDEEEFPTPGGPVVLRVQICELNKMIKRHGQRIISAAHGCYQLAVLK